MAAEPTPFQLHLVLKLQNGQTLTPNEIRKMQQLGLDDPWPFNPGPKDDGSNQEDASGQRKQKDDASAVKSDDTLHNAPSAKPTAKWESVHVPDKCRYPRQWLPPWVQPTSRLAQSHSVPYDYYPDDWYGGDEASSPHSRYFIPEWKVHPEKYPFGPPIPPWVPVRFLSHWSQPLENDVGPGGGHNDAREAPAQSFRSWNLPDWAMQPTRRDPSGRPLSHPWDGAGGSDWNMGFRNGRWNLSPDAMQPTRRDPQGRPYHHPWDGAGGSDWNMGYRNYRLGEGVYPRAHPTPTFPTHNPYPYGFPGRSWRQVITTAEETQGGEQLGSSVRPSQTYAWRGGGVALRVGTGGSDLSGLLVKLFDQYLQQCVEVKQETPFLVEFYTSDSALTIDYLTDNIIDLGFTDTILLDALVKEQGMIDRKETAWRDHWMLVGPKNNPVGLPERDGTSVHALFATLYAALQADPDSPTIFLSRSDSSSAYVKESSIWSAIGRAPSTSTAASWYASSGSSAAETLAEAALIGAYTLTDSGTWYSASEETRSKLISLTVESGDEHDALLKPAELVVGSGASNKVRANDFVDWLVSEDGGQEVIKAFVARRSAPAGASKTVGEVDPTTKSAA